MKKKKIKTELQKINCITTTKKKFSKNYNKKIKYKDINIFFFLFS